MQRYNIRNQQGGRIGFSARLTPQMRVDLEAD